MSLRLSIPFVFTFLLLLIVMMELHEIVHITTGRILCGCWGPRDFNVWSLCEGCDERVSWSWVATLAGPLISFALMWLGMGWLKSSNPKKVAVGFSLIFSNIPFGRITTVMMGGGDEMVVVRHFLKGTINRTGMILIGTVLVLAVGLPPIVRASRSLAYKRRWLWILGFLTLPLAFLLVYTLIGLNTLLANGFLADVWIMGTPALITIHTLIALILLIIFRRHLLTINDDRINQTM